VFQKQNLGCTNFRIRISDPIHEPGTTNHNYVITSLYSELSNENRNQKERKGIEKALQTVDGFEKLGVDRHAVWGLGFK